MTRPFYTFMSEYQGLCSMSLRDSIALLMILLTITSCIYLFVCLPMCESVIRFIAYTITS